MNKKTATKTAGTTRYLSKTHDQLIIPLSNRWNKTKRLARFACLLGTFSLAATSQADLLWDNGDYDNGGAGVNNAYQSAMDDFYVPGAGWYVNSAETHGIFLGYGREVSDVDIVIWPAEHATGLPDGDATIEVSTISFEAVNSGESWGGYDKINVTVDFENTFLQGQEYYWIELDIKDQYGDRLKLLQRSNINHQDAHTGPGPYPSASGVDLGFRLFGTPIAVFAYAGSDKLVFKGADNSPETVTLQIAGTGKALPPGYYQIQMQRKSPVIYHFDQYGKHRFDFKPNPGRTTHFHTPIGDDMCKNAPSLIQEFCQSFVACAAYGMTC